MNRIDERFGTLKEQGKKALIAYLTVGDPDMGVSETAIRAIQEEGADIIELGVPFSDPVGEEMVVQDAHIRAMEQGIDIFKVFELIEKLRAEINIPILLSIYCNIMVQYGVEEFFLRCKNAGVDGVVISDLPYEENDDIAEYTEKYGVHRITLISPTSDERIEKIANGSKGFLYCVSTIGLTEEVSGSKTDFSDFFARIKKYSDIPVCAGFGIKTGEQIKELSDDCDGAVINSAFVEAIVSGNTEEESISNLRKKLQDLKSAIA